jgi:hypothetical protein
MDQFLVRGRPRETPACRQAGARVRARIPMPFVNRQSSIGNRLVALLLVPCLVGDPTLAVSLSRQEFTGRCTEKASTISFQEQALAVRVISILQRTK